jgi:hypothetical protein
MTVKFTATKLEAKGLKGILNPDSNGYYELVIGGLNTLNSAGEYYTLEGAKELFEQSSVFMRRVASGNLRGELGHPKKLPGQTMNDFFTRIMGIHEDNVCCHFSEVWLDLNYGKNNPQFNNPDLVAIMAKVKPAGPKGFVLEQSLRNPKENTCFSIRALTKDYMAKGRVNRVLQQIVCWDYVNEPGLALANKYDSPALEELKLETITEALITETMVNKSIEELKGAPVATEDTKILLNETKKIFNVTEHIKPISFKW